MYDVRDHLDVSYTSSDTYKWRYGSSVTLFNAFSLCVKFPNN